MSKSLVVAVLLYWDIITREGNPFKFRGYVRVYACNATSMTLCFLLGFIDENAVQELLAECAKMKKFDNTHVMSLKGVCLDGGPAPYIILPYMANGSLLSYLKKEWYNLVDNSIENKAQSQVSCFQTYL